MLVHSWCKFLTARWGCWWCPPPRWGAGHETPLCSPWDISSIPHSLDVQVGLSPKSTQSGSASHNWLKIHRNNHRDSSISLLLQSHQVQNTVLWNSHTTMNFLSVVLLRSACILLYRHICYINNNIIFGLWSANLFSHQDSSANFGHSCDSILPSLNRVHETFEEWRYTTTNLNSFKMKYFVHLQLRQIYTIKYKSFLFVMFCWDLNKRRLNIYFILITNRSPKHHFFIISAVSCLHSWLFIQI